MSLHWKMHTNFPFTRVFVLGIILFFLGLASMIIAIISFVTESWGHYVATGMWGGACILASGSTAIFASRLKSLASVKTLLVCAVITTFTSLTMLILSAGGLSLSSGFYNRIDPSEYNKRTSNLIHASLLVISVFCLSGSVLAVIVCTKYLFFEPYDKSKHRHRRRHLPEGSIRVSSSLRGGAPNTSNVRSTAARPHQLLVNEHPVRRYSDNAGLNRVQIEYRRAHRRSSSDQANSQQLHLHSQSRRHRHSHQETALTINGTSSSNPQSSGSRHRHGRHSSTRAFHHEKPSKGETEVERRIVSPRRNLSPRSSSNQATLQVRMIPSQISSRSQQIRLPTEFDEEELPPYEPAESTSTQPQSSIRCSDCDSGDESDTENSSSTDAHSYDAVELCVEGAEAVPMVNLRHQRTYRSRTCEQTIHFSSPPLSTPELDDNRSRNRVRRSRTFDFFDYKQQNQRKSTHSNSDLTLTQNNQPEAQNGEYECLISVSPEVCAINGQSSAVAPESDKIPHLVNENPYENGPCYENVRAIGIGNGESELNPLSKSCTSTTEQRVNSSADTFEHKVTASTVSARMVPVQMVNPSSLESPVSIRSSFGSPNSAFRPVKPPSQPHSPLQIHQTSFNSHQDTNNNFSSLPPNMRISPLDNTPTPAPLSEAVVNEQLSNTNEVSTYIEQGAIPKAARQMRKNVQKEEAVSLSWKNIPLPLSYNHSESLSNDEEKKLPSKQIPFAESNQMSKKEENNNTLHKITDQRILSPHTEQVHNVKSSSSPPPSSQHLSPSSSFTRHTPCNEPPTIPTQMVSSAPVLSLTPENAVPTKSKDRTLITTQPLSPPTQTSSSLSSLALASLQETSFLRSHPSQQRMGGNQALLQSRRDELRNLHLNQQPTRRQRPSSLIDDQRLNLVTNNHTTSLSPNSPLDRETAWSPADRSHPLSLSSYLMGIQPPSSQNHQRRQPLNSHQHYVPQPQQPRLGVQLQRRPQHHIMLNNHNDQVQEHNNHPQPQPNPQPQIQRAAAPADNAQQQSRSNRPLFSLLL